MIILISPHLLLQQYWTTLMVSFNYPIDFIMHLTQKIEQRIHEYAPVFELLPAVTIINNIKTGVPVYMSNWGLRILNTDIAALQAMGADYHKHFFHPDETREYVPAILQMLENNNDDEVVSFFQRVRPLYKEDWELWLSAIKIFMRDDEGKPMLSVVTTIPVAPEHNFSAKLERLLQENSFLHQNNHLYASLTKREKEILTLTAKDKTSAEIAETLFLSEDTVKTHRRNIKKKINVDNNYELIQFAQAFNMI